MLTNNTCPQSPPLEILGWGPGTSIFIKYPQASLQLDKLKDYPGAVLEFYFVSSKITWVLITKQIPTPLTPRKSLLQKPWGRTLRIRNLINTEGFWYRAMGYTVRNTILERKPILLQTLCLQPVLSESSLFSTLLCDGWAREGLWPLGSPSSYKTKSTGWESQRDENGHSSKGRCCI